MCTITRREAVTAATGIMLLQPETVFGAEANSTILRVGHRITVESRFA